MASSVYIYNYSTKVPFQIALGRYPKDQITNLIWQIQILGDDTTTDYDWALLDIHRVTLIAPEHVNNFVPGLLRPNKKSSEEGEYAVVPLELCKPHAWSKLVDFLEALGAKLPDGPLQSLSARYICEEEGFRYYTLWIHDSTLPWDVAVYSNAQITEKKIRYDKPTNICIFSGIVQWLFKQGFGVSEHEDSQIYNAPEWAVVDLGSDLTRTDSTRAISGFKPKLIHHVTIDGNSDCLRNNMHYLVIPFTNSTPTLAEMLSRHLLQKGLNGWRDYLIRGGTALNAAVDDTGPARTEGNRELYKVLD